MTGNHPVQKVGLEGTKKHTQIIPCVNGFVLQNPHTVFAARLGMELAMEYNFRFNKCHACTKHVLWLSEHLPTFESPMKFPQCMPDEHKQSDPVKAYLSYYKTKTFAKWTKRIIY